LLVYGVVAKSKPPNGVSGISSRDRKKTVTFTGPASENYRQPMSAESYTKQARVATAYRSALGLRQRRYA